MFLKPWADAVAVGSSRGQRPGVAARGPGWGPTPRLWVAVGGSSQISVCMLEKLETDGVRCAAACSLPARRVCLRSEVSCVLRDVVLCPEKVLPSGSLQAVRNVCIMSVC